MDDLGLGEKKKVSRFVCAFARGRYWRIRTLLELFVSPGPGLGWFGPFTTITRDSSRHTASPTQVLTCMSNGPMEESQSRPLLKCSPIEGNVTPQPFAIIMTPSLNPFASVISHPFVCLGFFFTGDGARCSREGYYQVMGRLDDVINVSGHRLGTAEMEDVVVRSFPSACSLCG